MGNALQYMKDLWGRASMTQRVLLLGSSVGCVVATVVMYSIFTKPNMVLLYGGLARDDAARMIEKIEEAGVQYDLSGDSDSIYVPKEKVATLRLTLAKEGLPSVGSPGLELLDNMGPGVSPSVTNERIRQATEGELARSIQTIDSIEAVRVHIVPRQKSAFMRKDQRGASASVIVTLSPGATLHRSNARAIVYLVSMAVRGLDPKNVTVIDNHGRMIEGENGDDSAVRASTFMEHQAAMEKKLASQAETVLSRTLPSDMYSITVAVELEHVMTTTEEKTVDPDSKVSTHEMMQSESTEGGKAGATPMNYAQPASVGQRGNGASTKKMVEESSYAFDQKRSVSRQVPGEPTKISVAAVVDLGELSKDPAETQKRLQSLTKLIKSAVGFTEGRDMVTVENLPFVHKTEEVSPLDEQTTTEFYLELGKRISLGMLVIGALGAVWIVTAPRRREAKAQVRLAAASAKALEAPSRAALAGAGQNALTGQYDAQGNLLGYDGSAEYDEDDMSDEAVASRRRKKKGNGDDDDDMDLDDLPDDAPMARKVAVMMKRKPEKIKQLFRSWVESEDEGEE